MMPFLFALLFANAPDERLECDWIIINARIYTVDSAFSMAQAMAIDDGYIMEIGKTDSILAHYWSLNVSDLEGKPVYPGFIDGHCHFLHYGVDLNYTDLTNTTSYYDVIERLKKHDIAKTGGWVIGRGWDQNDWEIKEFPSREALDKVFPETPVYIERVDGHAALINGRAMQLLEINEQSQVAGGIVEVKMGKCTGILLDNAMELAKKKMPTKSKTFLTTSLLRAQQDCFAVGLTSVQDAGLELYELLAIKAADEANKLKMRVYAMATPDTKTFNYLLENGQIQTAHLKVQSFKFYCDGALGSRGAGLLKPYSDDPENTGIYYFTPDSFQFMAQRVYNMGFQLCTHAIGDSANRFTLNTYASILQGQNDLRWRIEHCQVVDKSDLPKFGQYDILPSVQPVHATSDMYWAIDRLGPERIKNAYAYKDLMKQNGMYIGGSDFPVENIDPLYGFYAAVARKDRKNYPDKGFQKDQAVLRTDALKAMTIWAAYGSFEESVKGSLEANKYADFVILDKDILAIPEPELLTVKVLKTVVGGEVVYDAEK